MPGSSPSKDAPPKANRAFPHLTSADTPTLEDVARLIKDGKVKRVMVMAGAGISTAAGMRTGLTAHAHSPDFRSPGTGLYDNLANPEAIFDVDYLEEHPEAFYTLAKELYPGNFKPTISHYFFRLLQEKGLLHGCWTQNIDTLERIAGIKDDLIVEAHGSFASATCLNCRKAYTKEEIKPAIMRGEVVRCQEKRCKGKDEALIKPDIVFFGEGLPDRFFTRLPHFSQADLLLVLGTSLTVGPFNTLLHRVPSECPRVLLNLESVGEAPRGGGREEGFDFDGRTGRRDGLRDVRWLGEADKGVEELCRLLGWEEELRRLKEEGWREIDEAEGRAAGAADEDEAEAEQKDAEEKRVEVVEHVGESAGEKVAPAVEKKDDSPDVDELAKAVESVALDKEGEEAPGPEQKTTPSL
ncbi:Sir2 histone deacetylase Hst2 [Rhodotorula kratochvilovae]